MIIIKKHILFVLIILIFFFGCSAKDPEFQKIDVDQKEEVQVVVQPQKNDMTPDRMDDTPIPSVIEEESTAHLDLDQMLKDSGLEAEQFDEGLYRYTDDYMLFAPVGWDVEFLLPDAWKDHVTLLASHPNDPVLVIQVALNSLMQEEQHVTGKSVSYSHFDYCLQMTGVPREICSQYQPVIEAGNAAVIYEDNAYVYILETNECRTPCNPENDPIQDLIEKIGQERYNEVTDGFRFYPEDVAWLFSFDGNIRPIRPDQPTGQEQALIDSELVEFDPGMVWRYVGEDQIFQPEEWNVVLELPERWKEHVTVFSTHPCGDSITISIVPNTLIEMYMTALNRPIMNSYYDYVVRLIGQKKEEVSPSETAVLLHEDSQYAYYLETSLSRAQDCQESQIQQLLVEEIGHQEYERITSDFRLELDKAGELFAFTEQAFSTVSFCERKAGAAADAISTYIEKMDIHIPRPTENSTVYLDDAGHIILPLRTENGGIPAVSTAALAYDPNSGVVTPLDYLWRLDHKTTGAFEIYTSQSGLKLRVPTGYKIETNTDILHLDSQFLGKMYDNGGYYFELHVFPLQDADQPWQQKVIGADGFEIARDEDYSYMLWRATDVQYDPDDELAKSQFEQLESISEQWAEVFVFENGLIKNPYWTMNPDGYHDNKSAIRQIASNITIDEQFLYITVPVPFGYADPPDDFGAWTVKLDGYDGDKHTYASLQGKQCTNGIVYKYPVHSFTNICVSVYCEGEKPWTCLISQ